MLVNGTVYPEAEVDPTLYRLRILNACNARFLNLQLYVVPVGANGVILTPPDPTSGIRSVTNAAGPKWLVIGTEAGFLQKPALVPSDTEFGFNKNNVAEGSLITGNAERWDVLVDFSGLQQFAGIKPYPLQRCTGTIPRRRCAERLLQYGPARASRFGPDTRQIMRFTVKAAPMVRLNQDFIDDQRRLEPYL